MPLIWALPECRQTSFSFEPRYAGRLWSAPSSLYDYYNPEARVFVPPRRFEIKGR